MVQYNDIKIIVLLGVNILNQPNELEQTQKWCKKTQFTTILKLSYSFFFLVDFYWKINLLDILCG